MRASSKPRPSAPVQERVALLPAPARRLEGFSSDIEPSIDLIAGQEQSLVHGHYDAANILVSADAKPVRICPVDWELAALGSRFFDLASLCDGFEPPALHRIWDAYAEGAADAGLPTRHAIGCGAWSTASGSTGSSRGLGAPPRSATRLRVSRGSWRRGEALVPLVESSTRSRT